MAGVTQALQVGSLQHAQGAGALLLDAPAELFLHHELVEQHDIRRQFGDEAVETAVVQFDRALADAQGAEVFLVLAGVGRAAEGDVPALPEQDLEDLHQVPAGRRGAGSGQT